jgi:excisionase family DNA binding protein
MKTPTLHMPILLSVPEAARQLGCNPKTVRVMIADGTLPTVRLGRRHLINRALLVSLLEAGSPNEKK